MKNHVSHVVKSLSGHVSVGTHFMDAAKFGRRISDETQIARASMILVGQRRFKNRVPPADHLFSGLFLFENRDRHARIKFLGHSGSENHSSDA